MIEYTYLTCFFLCLYIVTDHSLPFRKKKFEKNPFFYTLCFIFYVFRYPRDGEEKPQNPLSMVMTEFHVLLLFPDRYILVN